MCAYVLQKEDRIALIAVLEEQFGIKPVIALEAAALTAVDEPEVTLDEEAAGDVDSPDEQDD